MTGPVHITIPLDDHIELSELARLMSVSPATIRRRLRALGKCLVAYPFDHRLRLVRVEDVRAIFTLVPAPERRRGQRSQET